MLPAWKLPDKLALVHTQPVSAECQSRNSVKLHRRGASAAAAAAPTCLGSAAAVVLVARSGAPRGGGLPPAGAIMRLLGAAPAQIRAQNTSRPNVPPRRQPAL